MADVVLKNIDGSASEYEGVNQVVLMSTEGEPVIYTEGTGGSSVQADYAQNNENEIDYIKNRPFYDTRECLLEYQDYTFDFKAATVNNITAMSKFLDKDDNFALTVGETYTITFDGVEYTCVCQSHTITNVVSVEYLILGNAHKFLMYNEVSEIAVEETNEPFVFVYNPNTDELPINIVVFDKTEEFTCGFGIDKGFVQKIDEKYIPELETDVAWEDIKNRPFYDTITYQTIMEETDCTFFQDAGTGGLYCWINTTDNQNFDPVFDLILGETYDVIFDDKSYTCVAFAENFAGYSGIGVGNLGIIGKEETGEPFVLGSFVDGDRVACYVAEGTSHNIEIRQHVPSVEPLDEKYIPDTIARVEDIAGMSTQVQADWDETDETSMAYIKNKPVISAGGGASVQANYNQNDSTQADYIKNRPFFDTLQSYKGDFAITPSVSFDLMNYTWWKATDLHPTVDELSNYRVVYESDPYKYSKVTEQSEILLSTDDFVTVQMDLPRIDNPERTINVGYCSVHTTGEVSFNYMGYPLTVNFPETGTYYAMPQGVEPDTSGVFGFETGELKSIDLKYISKWLPAYDNRTTLFTFDGNIDGKESVLVDVGTYFVKVRDEGIEKAKLTDFTDNIIIFTFINSTGTEESEVILLSDCSIIHYSPDVFAFITQNGMPLLLVVNCDTFSMDGLTATKGIYIIYMDIEGYGVSYAKSAICGEFKQLDPKFLPDDIGGNCLPEITTSDNDKVLGVVNGEWAATEAPSGLPDVTTSDNGKVLKVTNGVWSLGNELPNATTNDNGKVLKVTNGVWSLGNELPDATIDDNGKFLRIVNGTPAWTTVPNAEEVLL